MKYRIGVDIGGTNTAIGVVTSNCRIAAKSSFSTGADRPFKEIVSDIATAINKTLEANGLSRRDCSFIGLGCPGTCNTEAGRVVYACNLSWRDVPLASELHNYFDAPSAVGNDAACAALGEVLCGAARGRRNVVLLTIGTGVGCGIIIDGKIYSGEGGAAGEFGHTTLVFGGEACSCGRSGCLERYASANALKAQTMQAASEHPDSILAKLAAEKLSGRTAFDAMRQGDPAGEAVVSKYIEYLGAAVTNAANLFRPEMIILGGGICNEGETLLAPLRSYLAANIYGGGDSPVPALVRAELGNDAGIIGAAYIRS